MIRVTHAIATLGVGGVERQLVELVARTPPDIRHRVVCLTRGGPFEEPLADRGVPVEILGKRGRYDARVLPRLVDALHRHPPDVLHTYMFTANLWGRLAAVCAGVDRVITSVRCLDPAEMRGFYLWSDRLLVRRAQATVAVSGAIASWLVAAVGVPSRRIRVIRNSKDPEAYPPDVGRKEVRQELGVDTDDPLVGLVGRLHPQKGQDLLVEAAPRVLDRVPGVRFLLLGDGPWREEIQRRVREAGLSPRFLFIPWREDMAAVYAALDLVVLPSRFEGLPNVVVEALAARRPVVASRIAGTEEILDPPAAGGPVGLLVPPEDPPALAGALVRLLEHPEEARAMARAGRRHFLEHLTMDRAVDRLVELYRRLAREA